MKKNLKVIFGFVLCAATASCSSLVYQPMRETAYEPAQLGFEYRPVLFYASDSAGLLGWFFPARLKPGQKAKGTFVQFHGNAENRTTHFASLVWAIDEGYNFFTFDYRGYSGSHGSPNQEGLYRDALAAIRWVKENTPALDQPDIILFGQSLGGAVLARAYEDVIDRSRIKLVVIDSSFYSYQAIASDMLSRFWFTWPFQWIGRIFIEDTYSPERSFAKISPTPLLVITEDRDPAIPARFGDRIFELANEPKKIWRLVGNTHVASMQIENGKYRHQLVEYLENGIR